MPRYKTLEYCSIIDALRWLAFDIEPVSQEDEEVLVSRGMRKPLNLSPLNVVSGFQLGKVRYGSGNNSIPKMTITDDEMKLRSRIFDLKDLLKNYPVDISAVMLPLRKPKPKKLIFQLKNKDVFINCGNPQMYEVGYSKLAKGSYNVRTKSFCGTKINFKQLKKAAQERLKEEKANLDWDDCQTRKKAIKAFLKTLPPMSQPDAVREIWKYFGKSKDDKGFSYQALANHLTEIKSPEGEPKFPKASRGNFRKK